MKRAIAAAATALIALPLAALAVPAQADTRCTITNFSPRTVVMGTGPVVPMFDVSTTGCREDGWEVVGEGDSFGAVDYSPEYVFEPSDNLDAGVYDVLVDAYNADDARTTRVFDDGLRLQRRTGFDNFDASPEVLAKGTNVSVKGRLILANWDIGRYVGFTGRPVVLEFRAATGTTYRQVKTTTTGTGGLVNVTAAATQDGYWRLRYAGSVWNSASLSAGDYIDVK